MAEAARVLMALAMQIVEEEEAEYEQVMIAVAQVGVAELLELEDGVGLGTYSTLLFILNI